MQAINDITINSPIVATTAADLTLQAGGSMAINANIDTDGGVLRVVVDSLGSSPNVSPTSQLIIGPGVSLLAGSAGFWSAIRSNNVIDSSVRINEVPFSAGTYDVNTSEEVWGTFYPDGTIDANSPFFTFFYEEGHPPAVGPSLAEIVRAQDQSAAAWGEFFNIFHPFNEYISDYLSFDIKETYKAIDQDKNTFFLRTRNELVQGLGDHEHE